MLKINKKVEYALIALKFMAMKNHNKKSSSQQPQLTTAREICDRFNTPFDTTAKVMQKMNAHNIVNSVKGIKGGYFLAKSLREISYMDLVKMIEGRDFSSICETPKGLCECYEHCNIKKPIERLNLSVTNYLNTLTLEQLLVDNDVHGPINGDINLESAAGSQVCEESSYEC